MIKNPEIIFEDDDLLVINKPAGLSVHGDLYSTDKTLADWILENYPALLSVGEPLVVGKKTFLKPGIVHRLDKETSGVMIIAKTEKSFLNLKSQFKEGEVKKEYLAIVTGEVKKQEIIVDLPIGRSSSDPRKRVASHKAKGLLREAMTDFKLIENFNGYSLINAYPKTGRTHQIRVHLKAVQFPVLGDKLYGQEKEGEVMVSRQMLHASKITIKDLHNEEKTFEAPSPEDFRNTLEKLRGL